jgi:C1A family cysteine protease
MCRHAVRRSCRHARRACTLTITVRVLVVLPLLVSLAACSRASRPGAEAVDAGPADLLATDTSPAKPPPALRAPPSAPPLPDLPTLEKQEPKSASKGSPALSGLSAWSGDEVVSLIKLGKGGSLFGRSAARGAEPLVRFRELHVDATRLPKVVDHRASKDEGPVRNQKSVPACSAFALATAIDHAVGRWTGTPGNVSVMEIWARYHEPYTAKAVTGNLGEGVGPEAGWPFDERLANTWVPCEDAPKAAKGQCGLRPDPARVAKTRGQEVASITSATTLDELDTDDIKEQLAAGKDVIVALEVPRTLAPTGKVGARYLPHWRDADEVGGHAVVLAGYATLGVATYFLVHNSWGTSWGDGGYAYIHEKTLKSSLREALVVDAEPVQRDKKKQKVDRATATCQGTLVPDTTRTSCSAPCPDGGPRHGGVCGQTAGCPEGMVNLTGECVLAAPTTRGAEASGLSWRCGASGCTYEVPRTIAADCSGNVCRTSCPAPSYRLAKLGDDLVCVL